VVEITQAASVFLPRSEFDEFLFSPIGVVSNAMALSVLSMLARLDIDPWQEAAELAGLPGKIATERLASLIAAPPNGLAAHFDPTTIAAHLITLLPRRSGSNSASRQTVLGAGAVTKSRAIAISAILIAFLLGAAWILASHQPSPQVDSARAPASDTVFHEMPPPNSSR
jgi:hypothetical protein